jgi:hypothetical protein
MGLQSSGETANQAIGVVAEPDSSLLRYWVSSKRCGRQDQTQVSLGAMRKSEIGLLFSVTNVDSQ